MVYLQHRDAAACPVLDAEAQRARCRRGRAAVTLEEQRCSLVRRAGIVGVVRWIIKTMSCVADGGREFDCLDAAEIIGDAEIGAIEDIGSLLEYAILARF